VNTTESNISQPPEPQIQWDRTKKGLAVKWNFNKEDASRIPDFYLQFEFNNR